MRIVIAPDKFKGTLSAAAAAEAIADGLHAASRACKLGVDLDLRLHPMADGGDGTLECLLAAWGGRRQQTTASGPFGEQVTVPIGLVRDASTAIVESATVIGHALVPANRRDPLAASSFGLGQVLRAVMETGVENILIGLGGTATVDGGAGMMQALGLRLIDAEGRDLPSSIGGGQLAKIHRIAWHDPPANLDSVQFTLAVDVLNPLCGANGAARVFGPQKGADPRGVEILDAGLALWADVLASASGTDARHEPGVGAAGGIALPLLCLAQADVTPGVDLVIEAHRLAGAISTADLVVTGEGRLDGQSLMGKVVGAVARMCHAVDVPCVALIGAVGPGVEQFHSLNLRHVVIGGALEDCADRLYDAGARILPRPA